MFYRVDRALLFNSAASGETETRLCTPILVQEKSLIPLKNESDDVLYSATHECSADWELEADSGKLT